MPNRVDDQDPFVRGGPQDARTFTIDDIPDDAQSALAAEVQVAMPVSAWDELEMLADAFPEEVATTIDGAMAEGEEEDEVWVFYCSGMTIDQASDPARRAVPEGWTAEVVEVPEGIVAPGIVVVQRT